MWRCVVTMLIVVASSSGQSARPAPSFDAGEIRVNKSGEGKSSGNLSNGRLTIRNLALRFLLAEAWTMNPDDIYGPAWLDDVHVDVIAKAASPATPDAELRRMLQKLLKDRMKLVEHTEQRTKTVWALTVWKGPAKMMTSEMPAKPEDADCSRSATENSRVRLVCRHESMAAFAHELPQYAGAYVTSTVVDRTELVGAWDFSVEWTPSSQIESSGGLTLFDALQAQLGLQLRNEKLAVPVLVIDSMDRTPSDN